MRAGGAYGEEMPVLQGARVVVRAYEEGDIDELVQGAGRREVARTTLRIPHPYERTHAEQYLEMVQADWKSGAGVSFAVVEASSGKLVGGCGLRLEDAHKQAELGYWTRVEFWGKGYATEAAREVVGWGFGERGLEKVHAHAFGSNPASMRVLEKLGMKREGYLRRHILKWGEWEDIAVYGVLREEWAARGRR